MMRRRRVRDAREGGEAMKFTPLAAACAVLLQSCALAPPAPNIEADVLAAEASIDAASMLRHIRTLASDEFEGRAPGTRGEQLTVDYLVGEFKKLGLKPGNPDGTYVQKVPLIGGRPKGELVFEVGGRRIALGEPADFQGFARWQLPDVRVDESPLVFVGHGVVAPEFDWDDYKDVDVRSKTLLILSNDPQVPDPNDPTKLDASLFGGSAVTFYSQSDHKREVARQRGAAARIHLFVPGQFGTPTWADASSDYGQEEFDTRQADRRVGEVPLGAGLSDHAAERLFAAAGLDLAALKRAATRRDFRPVSLNARASLRVRQTLREVDSRNVVARIKGADAKLKHEWVIYTAHWDHFGRDESRSGDQIFNGALDNASGVAAMLEVARAFAALKTPPKRSILFLITTAEEQGLLGAKHYAAQPLYPLDHTLAALNTDVINVRGVTRDIGIIGFGRSTLADRLSHLAQARGRVALGDTLPHLGLFYRSDHKELAAAGVPALWMRRGNDFPGKPADYGVKLVADYLANHYHKVSDEVRDDWDLSGAVEDYRLYFRLGHEIANGDAWPEWKPGDEFKARRDEMMKRAGKSR
jgi:Zn-dependent M28 family amino/carboxypeptidase